MHVRRHTLTLKFVKSDDLQRSYLVIVFSLGGPSLNFRRKRSVKDSSLFFTTRCHYSRAFVGLTAWPLLAGAKWETYSQVFHFRMSWPQSPRPWREKSPDDLRSVIHRETFPFYQKRRKAIHVLQNAISKRSSFYHLYSLRLSAPFSKKSSLNQ